jgi:hypothetical protein
MDANDVIFHFDLPKNVLVQNIGQQFAGWLASTEPLDLDTLRFRIDGMEVEPALVRREDVEQNLPGRHVTGWHFVLDARFTIYRHVRALRVEALAGDRVVFSRTFCKSRHLLPPGNNAPLSFMHIPKTGGTALRHLIDYVFAGVPSLLVYGHAPGVSVDDFHLLPANFLNSREVVFGHFDFSLTPLLSDAKPKLITVLREPSELVRSYLAFSNEPVSEFLDNPQVRHLCGAGYVEPFGKITAWHLELALHNARAHCFVVQQERLQQFADDLTALFGLAPFPLGRVNETVVQSPLPARPLCVDLRYDLALYAACRDMSRSFHDFLNA